MDGRDDDVPDVVAVEVTVCFEVSVVCSPISWVEGSSVGSLFDCVCVCSLGSSTGVESVVVWLRRSGCDASSAGVGISVVSHVCVSVLSGAMLCISFVEGVVSVGSV